MFDPVAHQEAERIAMEWWHYGASNLTDAEIDKLANAYRDLRTRCRDGSAIGTPAEASKIVGDILSDLKDKKTTVVDSDISDDTDAERVARLWVEENNCHTFGIRILAAAYLDLLAQLREAEKLREFVEWCMATASWQGYDLHGGDMQDKAEELGLLVKAPADEAFREEYDCDEMFVVAWSPLAARRADTPTPTDETRHQTALRYIAQVENAGYTP